LERHLHDFLSDNWKDTSLGRDWDLHTEDGEVVGYEYPTPVGRIDLLAKHKRENRWLVVELKRDQSSDTTVGQALRYMGYVREKIAAKGDTVEGMIIAHAGDERIRYALEITPSLSLMLYEVDFRLKPAKNRP
jgi:RecB family endonuclease NucS